MDLSLQRPRQQQPSQVPAEWVPAAGESSGDQQRLRQQSPSAVLLVRPHHFRANPSTAQDNTFFSHIPGNAVEIQQRAYAEVTALADSLRRAGITVDLWEDTGYETPDSVFPNNWFSLHACGRLVLYPMWAPNRRLERRPEIIEHLRRHYRVSEVVDLSGFEQQGQFLEGTGAMVLDHLSRTAYACRSQRMSESLLRLWCETFGYEPVIFEAYDGGKPVYHSNVVISVGTTVALLGTALIPDPVQRREIRSRLRESGRQVLELSAEQVRAFAGNAIELVGTASVISSTASGAHLPEPHPVLALSSRAAASLADSDRARLCEHVQLLPVDVTTVESAGGSVRCMLAALQRAT